MLQFGDVTIHSRLIVGTGKYPSFEIMQACHQAAETEMVTLALRRIDLNAPRGQNILDFIDRERIHLLPNTAGCYTAEDAVITAQLGREALETSLVKLEVIGDPKTLYPDGQGTLEAAKRLVDDGFTVLPYCLDDPILCKKTGGGGMRGGHATCSTHWLRTGNQKPIQFGNDFGGGYRTCHHRCRRGYCL